MYFHHLLQQNQSIQGSFFSNIFFYFQRFFLFFFFFFQKNFQNFKFNKTNYPKEHLIFKSDLTKEKNIKKLLAEGKKKYGSIDGVIHCLYPKTKDWGTPAASLNAKSLKENLFKQLGVTILTAQLVINYFLKDKIKGKLILISSIQGVRSPKFNHYKGLNMHSPVEYTAIKSGIISMTKYFAKCYKKNGIAVNCVSPGGIFDGQPKKFIAKYLNECGNKGLLNGEDITGTIIHLLSDACLLYTSPSPRD